MVRAERVSGGSGFVWRKRVGGLRGDGAPFVRRFGLGAGEVGFVRGAFGLEAAEFVEAAEVLAVELGVVALVEAEEVGGVSDAVGEVSGRVGAGELFLEGGFVAGHGGFDLGGFGGPEALLTPLGVDGFGEEVVFVAVLGLVGGDIAGEEGLELGFAFGVEEVDVAEGVGQVVGGGVLGGFGFAFGRAGSGGF